MPEEFTYEEFLEWQDNLAQDNINPIFALWQMVKTLEKADQQTTEVR